MREESAGTGLGLHDADGVPGAVLDRAVLVLGAFDEGGPLTLTDVVSRTGLPRSSVHRMIARLVRMRWLRRDGRRYSLGLGLIELGSLALHQNKLRAAALPFLYELHRSTRLVVQLAVLAGRDAVCLEKLGRFQADPAPTRVGGRCPARDNAIGRALLANTLGGEREYSRIRRAGVAYEWDDRRGYGAIAVAVGPPGSAAAIAISGPRAHVHFDSRHVAPLRAAANAIWRSTDPAWRSHDRTRHSASGAAVRGVQPARLL